MPRLITIAVSHYCEKARWALERAAIDFDEQSQVPLLHMLRSRTLGGRRTVPCLIVDGAVFPDSTDILRWADSSLPAERKLYPEGDGERRVVEDLETYFDEKLGPHTRRYAYHYLLPRKRLILPVLQHGVPGWQSVVFAVGYPLARAVMVRGMNINEASAERSRRRVDTVFDRVEALLADGRPFLTGDRFSAADLAFAALSVPAVVPAEYPVPLPDLDVGPAALRERIQVWRDRPAGRHVLRMYQEER